MTRAAAISGALSVALLGATAGVILGACTPSSPPAQPAERTPAASAEAELVIPKMPADAGAAPPAPRPVASAPKEKPMVDNGWLIDTSGLANPEASDRDVVLAAIKASPHRAVVVADHSLEECSGAGGSHSFFTIVEHRPPGRTPPTRGRVHVGAHGVMVSIPAFPKGSVWLAAIDLVTPPRSLKNPSWCIPDITIHARAKALLPFATEEEALEALRSL